MPTPIGSDRFQIIVVSFIVLRLLYLYPYGYKVANAGVTRQHRSAWLTLAVGDIVHRARRVEKRLNQVDGVTANQLRHRAGHDRLPSVTAEDLVAMIEETGYTATLPAPSGHFRPPTSPTKPRCGGDGC
jgi:hypothetical protein